MATQKVRVTITGTMLLNTSDYIDEDQEVEEGDEPEEPSVDEAAAMLEETLEDGSADLEEILGSLGGLVITVDVVK